MSYGMIENVIEFLQDEEQASVTFCQKRFISKIRKLAEERPDECKITVENKDGSIMAVLPTKWIKISPPKQYDDETLARKKKNGNFEFSRR